MLITPNAVKEIFGEMPLVTIKDINQKKLKETSGDYIVFPTIPSDARNIMEKFPDYIDGYNKPFDKLNDSFYKWTFFNRMDSGWYACLMNPPRRIFAHKTRNEQKMELKKGEYWGTLPYALYALFLAKFEFGKEILTDYVHTNDVLDFGHYTIMIKNLVVRNSVIITHNLVMHGHRNTVMLVMKDLN